MDIYIEFYSRLLKTARSSYVCNDRAVFALLGKYAGVFDVHIRIKV